ncbi:MAG: heme lyase CcmF/NrfE family subunit [Pseudomonadota bacterium]
MIAEFGHFALVLALMTGLAQTVVPLVGAQKGWVDWMRVGTPAAGLSFVLTAISFAALTYSFVVSDFSVELVASNSHSLKPMLYKVSGVWGNHEGSLLLWVLILTLFGACVAWLGGNLPDGLKARTLAVQGAVGVAFMLFTIFTSNPFTRLEIPPLDGADLNPLLQDPGLAFHPPFLYLGYVGLSTAFSFAVAALIEGRVDAAWARWVRPWALSAWMFLTIGIALGSWWAYYELGWGGWWFWDPVENASFMPWLAAAALLHCAIVVEKRDTLKSWTILLAIVAFSLSLLGTFIVRSGLLTSVHAFASDPTRGVFILGILVVAVGGSLALFAYRANDLEPGGVFSVASRESALVLNNLLLSVSCGVVLLGTFMPIIREAWDGEMISVGPPFFNLVFTPFMLVLAAVLPIGAMLPWKRGKIGKTVRTLLPALIFAVSVLALVWAFETGRSTLAPVGMGLAAWLVAGSLWELAERAKLGRAGARETLRRLSRLPRADWGKAVAHAGLGILFVGVGGIEAWKQEDIAALAPGESLEVAGYSYRFDGVERVRGPNYFAERGLITVLDDGREIALLTPEKRFYPVAGMPTTEAGIDSGFFRDLYVVLGDRQGEDGDVWAVRGYVKPFANWLWFGAGIMSLGALLSLTDRRYRVGAVAKRKPVAAASPGAVPAE